MRRRVFEILASPRPGDRLATVINVALLTLIAANVVASILETDAELANSAPAFFRWFEIVSVAVFTAEYVLRIWSSTESPLFRGAIRGRLLQALRPMSLIDLAAIAPFYLELFIPGAMDLRFVRVLRLMRLFRLFRLGPVSQGFARLVRIIQAKRVELLVSMSVVAVATILAAGAIYVVEHDQPGTQFTSIPRSMWWSIVTITTVGYGDMFPVTAIGKAIGGLVSVIGICALALPVGIISSGYVDDVSRSRAEANNSAATSSRTAVPTCPHCGESLQV
jgi:voltage-gated potassium channel